MRKFRYYYGKDPTGTGFYWPNSEQKRNECLSVKRLRPAEFQSVYQCNPGEREGGIFLTSDFAYYEPPLGLAEGIQHPNVREFCSRFHAIVQSWDTAFEATSTADPSVCLTAGLLPCSSYHRGESVMKLGECEPHFDVYLLDLFRERLEWGDLTDAFRAQRIKWQPDMTVVEKRSSGVGLFQVANAAGANIKGVTAQEGKRARVVMGTAAGSVQGWFRLHRVRQPMGMPWVKSYQTELKDFTGDKTGKDDQVDATSHLVAHAIELGADVPILPSDWRPENVDAMMALPKQPMSFIDQLQAQPSAPAEFLTFIGQAGAAAQHDPFGEICQDCRHYHLGFCNKHQRQVIAFDWCEHFGRPRGRAAEAYGHGRQTGRN